jgi:hypothetical protein
MFPRYRIRVAASRWLYGGTIFLLSYPCQNFIGSFADNGDVIAASDRMEFNDVWKFLCEFSAHLDWNDVVICSVKNIDFRRDRTLR